MVNPILNPQDPRDPRAAILTNPAQANNLQPALQMPTPGGNARQSTRVPNIQPRLVDMRTEGNMRIGGAIMAASSLGGNEAINAGIQEYAGIQDYNRRAEDDAFALEEARRESIQARMDSQAKLNAPTPANDADMAAAAGKYQTAMEVLKGFKDRDHVVGWSSYLTEIYDNVTDDPRQNIRLKLQTLKVDRILSNVARTKGAISEKEMEIFASDQPSKLAGETIWANWVRDYAEALRVMNVRMRGGSTTGTYSDGSMSGSFTAPSSESFNAPIDTTGYTVING
jgi:hypothetical protein